MDQLRFWRSKSGAEVDFVLQRPDGLLGIEVKATPLRAPKLTRGARSFIDAYAPRRLYVMNLGFVGEERIGETRVRWVGVEVMADGAFLSADLR